MTSPCVAQNYKNKAQIHGARILIRWTIPLNYAFPGFSIVTQESTESPDGTGAHAATKERT